MNTYIKNRLLKVAEMLAEAEMSVPNLDAMSPSELMKFWNKWHRATKQQAAQLVGVRKNVAGIVHTLAAYAAAKAAAMDLRIEGEIERALVYEKHCDIYYESLPEDVRW